jgi:hypothetical protein
MDSIISSYFLTGSTGFIGFHQFLTAVALLIQGYGEASPEIDEDKKIS